MKRRNLKNVYIYALTAIQCMLALKVSGALTSTGLFNFDEFNNADSTTAYYDISTTTINPTSTTTNSPDSTTTDSPTSTTTGSPTSTKTNSPSSTTTDSPTSTTTDSSTSTKTNSPSSTTTDSPTSTTTGSPTSTKANSPSSTTLNDPIDTTTNSPIAQITQSYQATTASNPTISPRLDIWSPTTITTETVTANGSTRNTTNSPVTTRNTTNSPVTTTNIPNSPVTTTNITNSPVTTRNTTNSPVITTNIPNSPVTTTNILNAPVTTRNTTNSPVTTTHINTETITSTGSLKNMTTTVKTSTNGLVSTSLHDQTTQFNMNHSATPSSLGTTPPGLITTTPGLNTITKGMGATTQGQNTTSQNTTTPSQNTTTPSQNTTTPIQNTTTQSQNTTMTVTAAPTLRTTTPGQGTNSSTIGIKEASVNPTDVLQSNSTQQTYTVNPAPVVQEYRYLLAVPHALKDVTLFPNSHLNATLVMITSEIFATPATVTVYEPTKSETNFILVPGSEQLLSLTLTLESSGVSRRGVLILALGCLQVTLLTKITYPTEDGAWHLLSLSATYILPHMMLYTDYVVVSYTSASNTTSNRLFIVSADDDSKIIVRFTRYVTSPTTAFTLNGTRVIHPDSVEVTLPLAGQLVLECEGDLTGTRVRSSRPLAVFISVIELTGDVSYEQLLPVIQSVTSFTSWHPRKIGSSTFATTPDSYTVGSGAAQVYFQLPQDNRTFVLSLPGDTYQFHLNQTVNITASQSFTGVKFLHRKDTTISRRLVDCIASLTAASLWRYQYSWAIPRYYLPQNSTTSSAVHVVVIVEDVFLDFLKLDGSYFKPDVIETVLSSEKYVVVTHRVGYGYHTLNNDYSLFGVYVYGETNEKTFCTTAGMNHTGHSFSNLGEFPIPGNAQKSDIQDYSVASTTITPNNDVTAGFSQSSLKVSLPDVSTSPPVTANTTTTPPSHSQTVCPTLPTQVKLINMTSQDLAAILDEIRDDLSMDTTKLSSYSRRLVSIPDHRPSSTGMGVSGIAFIVVSFLLLVSGDVVNVGRWLRACCKHKK